jgi:hypothetical protein
MSAPDDLGFSFETRRNGDLEISRHGAVVVTVRGRPAAELAAKLKRATPEQVQQLLARATGNYKRGNERTAGSHPRNR